MTSFMDDPITGLHNLGGAYSRSVAQPYFDMNNLPNLWWQASQWPTSVKAHVIIERPSEAFPRDRRVR